MMKINREEDIETQSCDICCTSSIIKIDNQEKILYRPLKNHKCCKGKSTCIECSRKLGWSCPYCRQQLNFE